MHPCPEERRNACSAPSLPAKQLEDIVVEQIKALGRDPGALDDALQATHARLQEEVDALQGRRSEVEKAARELGHQVGEVAARAGIDEGEGNPADPNCANVD